MVEDITMKVGCTKMPAKVAERRMENVWFLLDSIKWILERFEEETKSYAGSCYLKVLLRAM